MDFTYTYCSELFDGSQGGLDQPGNPSPAMVGEVVNEGASIVNYTGHGSDGSWGTSGFSSNNVNQLTNNDMYPFIWSVACVNGNFVGGTCFAEAWLRATNDNEPSGAVATLMSTINQSWDPPMCGQDEMNDILVESYENNIKRTFGGLSMNGCMLMNDEFGSGGYSMTDTWNCFGDPSVVVRTAMPEQLTASYNETVFIGTDQLIVTTNATEGMVALTLNGEIIATAWIDNGTATLTFEALGNMEVYTLAVTSFNYIPFLGQLEVIPANGPYIVYHESAINDENGNNNGLADYGETIMISLGLENIGIEDATNVSVTLSSTSEFVTITDNEAVFENIPQGGIVNQEDVFTIEIDPSVPDMENITLDLAAVSGDDTWNSNFTIIAHAPALAFLDFSIDDSDGNGNGVFDPGETVSLSVSIENNGSAEAFNISGLLETTQQQVEIEEAQLNFGSITPGGTALQNYTLTAGNTIPQGSYANFEFTCYTGENEISSELFDLRIGHPKVLIVDLDQTPISGTAINELLNSKNMSTDYMTAVPDQISDNYNVVFVCLGVYPQNSVLNSTDGYKLASFVEAGGSIYMEGGDTWFYDTQTEVHLLFNINATDDGSGDLGNIEGAGGAFSEGFSYSYDGENNYIDHIAATGTAFEIFINQSPEYVCAIANNSENYKTIGSSFEFGGLTDGDNTKEELLDKYLEFFGMTAPAQPQQASGTESMCQGEMESPYSIPCLEGITTYLWELMPAEAGEITGTDTTAMVSWNTEFAGEASIQVCGMNEMGPGPMSEPLMVSIYANPETSLGADTSICFYHTVEIIPAGDFATYEWMNGSTESSIIIDSTFGQTGEAIAVSVMVTDENGCTGEAMVTITLDECAGIDESRLDALIGLYPNPSNGEFYIDIAPDKIEIDRIDICNTFGSLVMQIRNISSDNNLINLNNTREGIYFVNIYTNKGLMVKKLIIE